MRKEKWGYKAYGLGEATVIFSRGMNGRSNVIVIRGFSRYIRYIIPRLMISETPHQ